MNLSVDRIKESVLGLLHYFRDFLLVKEGASRSTAIPEHLIKEYNSTRRYTYSKLICYAPFKSMYFSTEGKVYACCYNRSHVLGTFPEQSLKEIWKGESINKLRAALKSNDFTLGCYSCLTQLEEGTYSSVLAKYFDTYPLGKYPVVMEFELSNVCNMACVMCDGRYSSIIRKERENLPPVQNPYDAGFVQQLEEFIPHLSKAKFQGGEPFIIPICYDIWEKIIDLNPRCVISVQTNGSVLNERMKKLMERGNFHITVSVDAVSREVFDTIRLKGNFETVMTNIQYFRSYSKSRNAWFGVATCPMQQNWHEIPDIINYCNAMNAEITFNRVWHPPQCALWNCPSDKLEDILKFYSTFEFPELTLKQTRNKQQFTELINQIRQWVMQQKSREARHSKFAAMDNIELKKELLEKIASLVESSTHKNASEADIQIVLEKMERIVGRFSEHPYFRTMLYKLHEIPADVLYNEFRENTEEMLLIQAENYLKEL